MQVLGLWGLLWFWSCIENLHGDVPRRHPNELPEPHQLAPFKNLISAACIHDLILSVTTHNLKQWERVAHRWTGIYRASPSSSAPFSVLQRSTCSTADLASYRLFISHSILPPLLNKTLRYLNAFAWGRSSPSNKGTRDNPGNPSYQSGSAVLLPCWTQPGQSPVFSSWVARYQRLSDNYTS